MKSEKRSVPAFLRALLCAFVLILPLAGCGLFGPPDYTLSVTVEAGVQGTPASGEYVYPELQVVDYKYTPLNSKHTVVVLLDGSGSAAEGTVTIYKSTALVARVFDVRAKWKVTYYVVDSTVGTSFDITFSGADLLAGTFSESNGRNGTWDAASGTINFNFSDWEKYKFTGTLSTMSGTWTNGTATGTWSSSKVDQ
jgi:hypothetical protein